MREVLSWPRFQGCNIIFHPSLRKCQYKNYRIVTSARWVRRWPKKNIKETK